MKLFKQKLKSIIEDNNSLGGKIFDICIQILIVASLVTYSIGTIPDLSDQTRNLIRYFEIFTIIVFTLEYILRILVADNKLKYIFSFYGIIDLLAILPFYLSLRVDLRSLRILRVFRVFRMIKIIRYSQAMQNFQMAIKMASAELTVFLLAIILLFFLSGLGIYSFENQVQPEVFTSVFSSIWWAVVTLSTVGYGDMIPITVGGKILTSFILMLGVGLVAVPTGIISSALTKVKEDNLKNKEKK